MRQHLRVLAVMAAAAASLAITPSALAATPEPSPTPTREPWTYIEYSGLLTSTDFARDGETLVHDPTDFRVSIRCGDDGCVFSGLYLGDEYEFPIEGSSGTWQRSGVGSVCNNGIYYHGGTLTVEAAPTTISVTQLLEPGPTEFCPSETYAWGSTRTFEGVYSSGDPCVLEGAPCPPAEAVTAVPIASGPVTDASPRVAATPSVLSALATPAETLAPGQILLAAALTLVLVILMALPTHLLNSAVDRGSQRLSAVLTGVRKPRTPRSGLLAASLGVLAAGLISCFIDPRFGFDLASVRTLASVLVSFAIEVVLGWFLVIWLVKRAQPEAKPAFTFAPLTLLVVVATVLFTRITGFEPGIVFGLVAGVSFGAALATAAKARVTLVGLGYAFVFALLAWVVYALTGAVRDPGAVLVFVRESLSAITIAGIAALPIALTPLRGLAGHAVWSWNRWVWAGAYAVGLLGFFLVLLPMPFSWGGVHASLWGWIGLYLAYAAVAAGLWAGIVRPWKKPSS